MSNSMLHYLNCFRPKYLAPRSRIPSIAEIKVDDLEKIGIKGLIFDVDNTLCPYNERSLQPELKENFSLLSRNFKSCILSNTTQYRRKELSELFGIPAIQTWARKPSPDAFKAALDYLQLPSKQVCMIGDRLLTDIAGGNIAGMHTLKVEPLNRWSEPLPHTIVRSFENFVLGIYEN